MKQRITKEQLKEITEDKMKILAIEWTPEIGDHYVDMLNNDSKVYYVTDIENISKPHLKNVPLLSIGQMIEILDQRGNIPCYIDTAPWGFFRSGRDLEDNIFYARGEELCDVLWEEVKGILPKEG